MDCKICGKYCKDYKQLGNHISREHKIKTQLYYDTYINTGTEHICSLAGCSNSNKFLSVGRGYTKCCCQSHAIKHPETQLKLKQSRFNHFGDENYGCFGSAKFKEAMIEKYGVDNYFKYPEFIQSQKDNKDILTLKKEQTCLNNYGVKYYLQSEEGKLNFTSKKDVMKENYNKTCQEKYGLDWYSQTEESKQRYEKISLAWELKTQEEIDTISLKRYEVKVQNGSIIQKEFYTEWERYCILVNRITRKNIKKLFENWDGMDYYTKEIIEYEDNYSSTNKLYPSIDHKISKIYGFKNNIPPEIIGDLSNLCITSRSINSSKNYRTEEEYIEFLQNKGV